MKKDLCLPWHHDPAGGAHYSFKTALANSNFMFFRQSPCMQGTVKIVRREKKERDQSLYLFTRQSRDLGGRDPFNKKRDKNSPPPAVGPEPHPPRPPSGGATANLSL
ncbi:hypothetical protein ATANTOWER_032762 [Ataeniobius toweri]|uniref:Uncharacterized protein n=1 Tax=Ataeniobius toweri TaxID=208326 RepID=A0ABU7BIW2_9TELE|nr:hypothetical protein [Ataeniobius toweri]